MEWRDFLDEWNRSFLSSIAGVDRDWLCDGYEELAGPIATKWLGHDGASQAEIEAAQLRLGTGMPSDWAAFMRASNGWVAPGFGRGFLISPLSQIAPFPVRGTRSVEILTEYPEYFFSEEGLDLQTASSFVLRTFQISDDDNHRLLLFDPGSPAFQFWHHDFHGVNRRFRSFTDLILYCRDWSDRGFTEVLEMYSLECGRAV